MAAYLVVHEALTHYSSVRKLGFLMFSEGIEKQHRTVIG